MQTPVSRGRRGMSPEPPQSHEREPFAQRLEINLRDDPTPHSYRMPATARREDEEYGYDVSDEMDVQHEDEENEYVPN